MEDVLLLVILKPPLLTLTALVALSPIEKFCALRQEERYFPPQHHLILISFCDLRDMLPSINEQLNTSSPSPPINLTFHQTKRNAHINQLSIQGTIGGIGVSKRQQLPISLFLFIVS